MMSCLDDGVKGSHNESSSNSKETGSQLNPINIHKTGDDVTDPRSMRPTDLSSLINANENLTKVKEDGLIDLLMRHIDYMTSKPGKYHVFLSMSSK
jgi:hypothetical protein